jgi:hypothetical protein
MAGPEATQRVNDSDEHVLELGWLPGEGPSVTIWVLLDSELSDRPLVGRLPLEDGLVDLLSGPGPPDPQDVRVIKMSKPADLHVVPAKAVAEQ